MRISDWSSDVCSSDLAIPDPVPAIGGDKCSLVVTGIGGTGVVTIGAIIGMAAHLDGKAVRVMDMTGLAQKGGAVVSHIQLAPNADDIRASKISAGADRSEDARVGKECVSQCRSVWCSCNQKKTKQS